MGGRYFKFRLHSDCLSPSGMAFAWLILTKFLPNLVPTNNCLKKDLGGFRRNVARGVVYATTGTVEIVPSVRLVVLANVAVVTL